MAKKIISLLIALTFVVALAACGGGAPTGGTAPPPPPTGGDTAPPPASGDADTSDRPMSPLVISGFVGDPNHYQRTWNAEFESRFPELGEVQTVITDANNRPMILRTAIAAGDPPAIGFFWGTRLNSFFNIGMCLDLRPYFDPADIALLNESLLQPAIGPNNELFAIPTTTVYFTTFYNRDLFEYYGFEHPETWDDLTAIFSRVREDGLFGFSLNTVSLQDGIFGLAYAELEERVGPGTSYALASGEVSVLPGTPAGEIIREVTEQLHAWFDAGYWYPGEGAISVSAEESNAAFARGSALMTFTFSGAFAALDGASDFNLGVFMKPTSAPGMTSVENIEPSVYFIPSNASEGQINSAIEWMNIALTQEGQQAIVDSNNIPSIPSFQFENMSPILAEIMGVLDTDQLVAGLNPVRASAEMFNFIKQVVFTGPISGVMTIDEMLHEFERIRLEAYEEMNRQ